MKATQVAAFLAPAAMANAQWWGGAPQCASSCMSSAWNNPTAWPAPTSLCAASTTPAIANCVQSACSATPTVWSSYSSLSSSLCSKYASCTKDGTAAVRTITATADTWNGGWWNDASKWGGKDFKDWNGGNGHWKRDATNKDNWPKTLTSGQVYTVTGCDWNDGYWGGFGWGSGKGGPWGWGTGWTAVATSTGVVTRTFTRDGTAFVTMAPATVAVAVSGAVTTTSTFGFAQAESTSLPPNSNDAGRPTAAGVKVVAAALAGFVGVALAL